MRSWRFRRLGVGISTAVLLLALSSSAFSSHPPSCLPAGFVLIFDEGEARLSGASVKTLGEILKEWRKDQGLILVSGHISQPEEKLDLVNLGTQRAKAVAAWLTDNGAKSDSVWLRDQRAAEPLMHDSKHEANRRTHVMVTRGNACERADRERAEWVRQNCLGPIDWALSADGCRNILNDIGRGFR